jgi:hypothetical protein
MMAEILFHGMEQKLIKHTIENKGVNLLYCIWLRYTYHVREKITPGTIIKSLITQYKALQFTSEEENNSQIPFLDLNLTNRQITVYMDMYRKSTATDTVTNMASK